MASSSLPRHREYDVFLSFRGEDTRKAMVSHLYKELVHRGIVTFRDDSRLEIGDNISEELRRAIESSSFAVVVLSKNYVTSKWCLMELQLIMELMREGRLKVFPVFYGVDPSDVRHQRRSFALERHQGPDMVDQVSRWREALNRIANLAGINSSECIDDATMVDEIAENISRQVTVMHKLDFDNFVGMETHMKDVTPLLDLMSKEARIIIGIWGMGGVGKSSIAKCLFDQLSPEYPARCFIENIKGICKDNDHDLVRLQNQMLCSFLPDDIRIWSVEAGRAEIKARLRNQKVLLVLDGVDKVAQVHALAKETSWFGPGSRIIITTRDRGLLKSCGVETLYEVKCLDDKDSLQMFKQIAFGGGSPPEGFEELVVRTSRLAHGLPSALQAHALFLRGRSDSPEEWEEAISGLESSLDENIVEILKISYDGLQKLEYRNVFLHVACLFNGESLQRVISLLDGTIPERSLGMRVLAEKSLIKISANGCVVMHKLVEQMGREIMHNSRKLLVGPEEICYALAIGNGTQEIECMSLHTCEMTSAFSLATSFVNRMHNLKFLKVYKHLDDRESRLQLIPNSYDLYHLLRLTYRSNSLQRLSYWSNNHLRLFHWDAFSLKSMHFCFSEDWLVELNLRHSNLKSLWSGKQKFRNLKRLDVTGSKNLRHLPDLSCIRSLEELILEQCTRLEGIPKCIGKRSTLKKLKLSYNKRSKRPLYVFIQTLTRKEPISLEFPDGAVDMDELMNLSIEGDIKFEFDLLFRGCADYLSITSEQQFLVTSTISFQQAPRLISEFNRFNCLKIMRFSYEENLEPLEFSSSPVFPNLKELKLINLNIQEIPYEICHLELLEKLDLSGNDFEKLPEAMTSLSRLKTLWLRNCVKLEVLPELTQVRILTLSNCRNLKSLVNLSDASQDGGKYCLLELCLENCKNVEPLSDQLSHFTKLTYLDLSGHDFTTVPASIIALTSLVTLCLNNCKNLTSLINVPLSIQFLDAHGCDSLEPLSVEYLKTKQNKELQSSSFHETEMPSYARNHLATKDGLTIRLPKILRSMFLGIPICIILMAVLLSFFQPVSLFSSKPQASS